MVALALVFVVSEVEDDVHQIANIPDASGMVMKINDGGSLMHQHGLAEIVIGNHPIGRGVRVGGVILEGVNVQVTKVGLIAHLGGLGAVGSGFPLAAAASSSAFLALARAESRQACSSSGVACLLLTAAAAAWE